jgi:hypothetical protein
VIPVAWSWPPQSPNINPCVSFPWGFLTGNTYKNNPHVVKELKGEITVAEERISEETPAAVT